MIQQVLNTINHYRMFSPGEKVVVAVSGGPDSVALLHILKKINIRLCLELSVAHFDHRMRRDSARDLLFVKNLACDLDLPFYGGGLNLKKRKRGKSSEDFLRTERYAFLLKICSRTGAEKIAVGHTKDDQAETVIMRILRGSGLAGLSAIAPKRHLGGIVVVRPLIEISRQDILTYLNKTETSFVTDPSNLSDDFMRNKIRRRLLPLLAKDYNPRIKEALANLAMSVSDDYAYIQDQAVIFFNQHLRHVAGKYCLDLKALRKLDLALKRLVVRCLINKASGHLKRISFQHWQEIEDLLEGRPSGSEVHLPFDITLCKTKSYLALYKR